MEVLTLSIKQEFFDEILSGVKKSEFRELRPSTFNKHIESIYLEDEEDEEDENSFVHYNARPYDYITFYTGAYKGKRKGIKVEALSATFHMDETEDGKNVTIDDEDGEPIMASGVIEYHLGKVIEKINF